MNSVLLTRGLWSLVIAMLYSPLAVAGQCSVSSGAQTNALLELYTSEGCSSCPPADRWLSSVVSRGEVAGHIVPLALHVDYWDYIGWKDRFAKPGFSARQRDLAAAQNSRLVYTPQLLLNGRDYRGWGSAARFEKDVAAIARQPARADISLSLAQPTADTLEISVASKASGKDAPMLYLALYENGLGTQVRAGENGGATLHHDYVVREWRGPFPLGDGNAALPKQKIALQPDWKLRDLGVAVFVQNRVSGAVLQSLALGWCS